MLKNELKYHKKETCKLLRLNRNFFELFDIENTYLPIGYIGDINEYRFLTITFDPEKFGLYNNKTEEQNYILATLYRLILNNEIKQLTGSFEYQKNGTTHAHIIIRTTRGDKEIEDFLRPFYTDRENNKYAIKCLPAKFPSVEDYIQKESTEYFRYDMNKGLYDEVVYETKVEAKKIDNRDKYQKLVDAYKKEVSTLNNLIKKYEDRISKSNSKPASNDV